MATEKEMTIKELEEDQIQYLYEYMNSLEPYSKEYKETLSDIKTLTDLRLRENEQEVSKSEGKKRRFVDYLKIGASILTFGAGAFLTARWRAQDMAYEETGIWKSSCSKTSQRIFQKAVESKIQPTDIR